MLATYRQAVRGFGRNARLYLVTLGLATLIIDGVYAVIFNLFLLRLGYDPAFVGRINSAGLLTFALASLPVSVLGRRWGSRRAMLAGLWVVFVAGLALPLAGLVWPAGQTVWLYVSYVALLFGYSVFFVNGVPFLMAATTEEQRDHAFSIQTAIFSLAAFSGGLLAGFLPLLVAGLTGASTSDPLPYRIPLLTAALLLLPGIWAAGATRQNRPEARTRSRVKPLTRLATIDRRYLGLLLVVGIVRTLQVAGMASANTFFNVYLDQALSVSTAQIGLIAAIARLLSIPAALAVAGLTMRWGHRRLVVIAGLGATLSLLPLALIPAWPAAAAGFIGVVVFSAIRFPAFLVYSMLLVTEAQRPTMSGLSEMTAGLAFAGMAFLGGALITQVGYTALFLVGAGAMASGTVLFAYYFRRPRGELARPALVLDAAD
jgi:MFS family permease